MFAMGLVLLEIAGIPASTVKEFNDIADEKLRNTEFGEFRSSVSQIVNIGLCYKTITDNGASATKEPFTFFSCPFLSL